MPCWSRYEAPGLHSSRPPYRLFLPRGFSARRPLPRFSRRAAPPTEGWRRAGARNSKISAVSFAQARLQMSGMLQMLIQYRRDFFQQRLELGVLRIGNEGVFHRVDDLLV